MIYIRFAHFGIDGLDFRYVKSIGPAALAGYFLGVAGVLGQQDSIAAGRIQIQMLKIRLLAGLGAECGVSSWAKHPNPASNLLSVIYTIS